MFKFFSNITFLSSSEREALERSGLQETPSQITSIKEEDGPEFSTASLVRSFSLGFQAVLCPLGVREPGYSWKPAAGGGITVV